MVNYQQLSSANPTLWSAAAENWSRLGLQLGGAAKNLTTQTHRPLASGGWSGQAASTALGRITMACTVLEAAEAEVSAVAAVLTGLAEATTVARGMLDRARESATRANLIIGTDGTVSPPLTSPGTGWEPYLVGRPSAVQSTCQQLIDEALRRASAADALAAAQLAKLATRTRVTNVRQAYDQDVGDSTRTELAAIAAALPTGPPSLVSTWWSGLSRAEQERLKLAVPTILADLNGIPESVKGELRVSDGIDRMKLIGYALRNWNSSADRKFRDDCTNFTSDALSAAGLQQNGSWPTGRTDVKHNWYTSPTGGAIDKDLKKNSTGRSNASEELLMDQSLWIARISSKQQQSRNSNIPFKTRRYYILEKLKRGDTPRRHCNVGSQWPRLLYGSLRGPAERRLGSSPDHVQPGGKPRNSRSRTPNADWKISCRTMTIKRLQYYHKDELFRLH